MKRMRNLTILTAVLIPMLSFAQDVFYMDIISEGAGISQPVFELMMADPYSMFTPLSLIRHEKYERELMGELDFERKYTFSVHSNSVMEYSASTFTVGIPVQCYVEDFSLGFNLPWLVTRKLDYLSHDASAGGLGDIALSLGYCNTHPVDMNWSANLHINIPSGDPQKQDDRYLVPLGTGSTDYLVAINLLHPLEWGDAELLGYARVGGGRNYILKATDIEDPDHIITTEYNLDNGFFLGLKTRYTHRIKEWLDGYLSLDFKMLNGGGLTSWTRSDNLSDDVSRSFFHKSRISIVELTPGVNYYYGPYTGRLNVSIPLGTNYEDRLPENLMDVKIRLGVTYFWAMDLSYEREMKHRRRERIRWKDYNKR